MKSSSALSFILIMITIAFLPVSSTSAQAGNIRITPDPDMIGPGSKVRVSISDRDLDADPNGIDEYEAQDIELVTFRTDRNELEEASPDLKETGQNTGVFEFSIQLETDEQSCDFDVLADKSLAAIGGTNPSIGVCPGDVLSIRYEDSHTASGADAVISFSIEIKSWDPEFATDKESYDVGDRVTINIIDFDANRDPDIAESLSDIRLYSDSDIVGRKFSAVETDENSGIFQLAFTTSGESKGNAIIVNDSDSLSIEYADEFPADSSLKERLNTFTMVIGGIVDYSSVRPSIPKIDANGLPIAGLQTELSTIITNNKNRPQPFVEFFEVRDSRGMTTLLAWQSGTLEPFGQTEMAVSWIPASASQYTVRTFAVTSLGNPQVLSIMQELRFMIE